MAEQKNPFIGKAKCTGHNCIVTVGGEKKPAEKNNQDDKSRTEKEN
jgi:hypothetical protein